MGDTLNPLARLQHDAWQRLRSRRTFTDVIVMLMQSREGGEASDIVNTINKTLAGQVPEGQRRGLAIMVPLPGFRVTKPNLPYVFGEAVFKIVVLENYTHNEGEFGTGITCEEAALLIQDALHGCNLAENRRITCLGMDPLDVENQEFLAHAAYEVTFTAPLGYNRQPECQQPSIVFDGDTLTITTPTAGASILATFDGVYPVFGHPSVTALASGASLDAPPDGTVVRAVAVKDGIEPSDAAYLVIS